MPLDFFCTGITLTHKSINCQPALFFKFTFRICKFKHSILFPRSISVSRSPQSQSKKAALPESWQLIEHEFETTGSNRAQTRPYGEDTRDLSVRLFKITNISQRKHKHFETSSHFLYKIIPIKEVTNCDRSEEFSKEIR